MNHVSGKKEIIGPVWTAASERERDDMEELEALTEIEGECVLETYSSAAVASDGAFSSQVGTDIIRRGGSAVDATIAAFLCNGLVNCHSMGIGGGFVMTVYNRAKRTAETLVAREMAPLATTKHMFAPETGVSSLIGGKTICVPCEIVGYWEAHQRYGRLPWKELFQPSIKLAREGIPIGKGLARTILVLADLFDIYPQLKTMFFDEKKGRIKRMGDSFIMPKMADTLEKLANGDRDTFYKGSLADDIIADIADAGGIMTKKDLELAEAVWRPPIVLDFKNDKKLYSVPPPSSGPVLAYIVNILDGYNFSRDDLFSDDERAILTYHRIIEAMKFAFAKRSDLGDADFVDIQGVLDNMVSKEYGESIRQQIDDNMTHDVDYYAPAFTMNPDDSGTSHLSVLDKEGNAVSATSTISMYFGSRVFGSRTGIIFNNQMHNFSTPGVINQFGVPPSSANFIEPGKRPLSSICPAIVVNGDGDVELVVGASGGPRVTTTTAQVTLNAILFGMDVNKAIDAKRVHHQLYPDGIRVEDGFPEVYTQALLEKGHEIADLAYKCSVSQAILRKGPSKIQACCDWRKGGAPAGF